MKNFPFQQDGKTFWYSRSVAAVIFVFTNDENGKLCVLANRRGNGAPDHRGEWNCPCGYLDFDETIKECAKRECFEETGIRLPEDIKLNLFRIGDAPTDNNQNVSLQFACYLPDGFSYEFSRANMEKDEVADIKWVNVDTIDDYEWAFNHNLRIRQCIAKKSYLADKS